MNFQALNNQLDVDMQVMGTVVTVEETKFTEKGKPFNKVNLRDDAGVSRWVKIFQGNNPPMSPAQQGQRLSFKLKAGNYQGKQYYQGFWQCLNPQQEQDYGQSMAYGPPHSTYADPPSSYQAPQDAPQAPKSAPPAPNYPPAQNQGPQAIKMPDTYAYPPTPESQIAMRRNIALESSCRLNIEWRSNDPIGEVLNVADAFYDWLESGMRRVDEPEQEADSSDFQK